ncbi:ABC transporter permease, partial [Modestobacter roseus]|nr:ABC transporter permease [Modestobacter roseus]
MSARVDAPAPRAGFAHAVGAEWVKFRSLRSTWATLAGLFAVALGVTALSMGSARELHAETLAGGDVWDPTNVSLTSYLVAQLVIGVLGILVVTSEYATGLIQTSLAATPARARLLGAKVVLAAAVSLVAGQALAFAAFSLGQLLLRAQDVPSA